MAPQPYSDGSSLPNESSLEEAISNAQGQVSAESQSPSTISAATTPSPIPQEIIQIENHTDADNVQDNSVPCYPTVGDIIPYDHALPDFIRQITNEPNLANLQSLSLRVISTLVSLHRMAMYLPNLRELDLEGSVLNSLRDIGCSLKNLHILKVGRCQLESLDGTFGLSSLRELYAQKNLINDVSPCSNLPHIRHIDVSGNRIRNISYAGFLSVCSKLKSIVFAGNPATEVADYRKHVKRILPQIESLDGAPFTNEENIKEPEFIENYFEGSDSSSTGIPDFSSVSPSDSMNNLFDSEEDTFFSDKKNKHAKNVANQDQFEATDYEVQEVFDLKNKHDFQDDSKIPNFYKKEVKRGLLEQAKITENKNTNIKQKCVNIQKLDKDIENRSKKSNLSLKANFSDDIFSHPETVFESSISQDVDKNYVVLSGSQKNKKTEGVMLKNDKLMDIDLGENKYREERRERPSTANSLTIKTTSDVSWNEVNCGAIKKRPSTSVFRRSETGNEDQSSSNMGISKLTSGTPICGNLTVALRNRKKSQTSRDTKCNKSDYSEPKIGIDESRKDLLVYLNSSGDNFNRDFTENEENLIEEDVLANSKKWREAFQRYRSNIRSNWEEDEIELQNE